VLKREFLTEFLTFTEQTRKFLTFMFEFLTFGNFSSEILTFPAGHHRTALFVSPAGPLPAGPPNDMVICHTMSLRAPGICRRAKSEKFRVKSEKFARQRTKSEKFKHKSEKFKHKSEKFKPKVRTEIFLYVN
jgi:hypothetical protein